MSALPPYALQDVWIGCEDGDKRQNRGIGTTLRFYDTESKDWRVIFVVPQSGKIILLADGAVGDRIVLDGVDKDGSRLRWSFNDIQTNSFLWRGEISQDNGKTWKIEQIMLRRHVI
ncbi:MAG TPA: hypothetical protein VK578_17490 [Edaphobacter sp.]|nr:hypothetical protein [Edaphobacter sp.]